MVRIHELTTYKKSMVEILWEFTCSTPTKIPWWEFTSLIPNKIHGGNSRVPHLQKIHKKIPCGNSRVKHL